MNIVLLENNSIDGYGWGNAYIVIPKESIFFGKSCYQFNELLKNAMNEKDISYSAEINEHHIESLDIRKGDMGKWLIGFHTCDPYDTKENWSIDHVQLEAQCILEHLKTIVRDIMFSDSVKDVIKTYNENGNVAVIQKQFELIEEVTFQKIVVLLENKGYTLKAIRSMLSKDKEFFDKKLKESEIEVILN